MKGPGCAGRRELNQEIGKAKKREAEEMLYGQYWEIHEGSRSRGRGRVGQGPPMEKQDSLRPPRRKKKKKKKKWSSKGYIVICWHHPPNENTDISTFQALTRTRKKLGAEGKGIILTGDTSCDYQPSQIKPKDRLTHVFVSVSEQEDGLEEIV